jgi:hypothetical protein
MNNYGSWAKQSSHRLIILGFWEEYLGFLLDVIIENDDIIIHFSNNDYIILPTVKNLKNQLCGLTNCRISILHTDLKDKEYLIRKEDREF